MNKRLPTKRHRHPEGALPRSPSLVAERDEALRTARRRPRLHLGHGLPPGAEVVGTQEVSPQAVLTEIEEDMAREGNSIGRNLLVAGLAQQAAKQWAAVGNITKARAAQQRRVAALEVHVLGLIGEGNKEGALRAVGQLLEACGNAGMSSQETARRVMGFYMDISELPDRR